MKRHDSIAPLSRQHHFGLLFCWKIKQGVRLNVDSQRIMKYVEHFWNTHLEEHFRDEEELLFSKTNDELTQQALQEHATINNYRSILQKNLNTDNLLHFAHLVNEHIRFEERTLFPHLEKVLTSHQLKEIEHLLHEHPEKTEDNYSDEFWLPNPS